MFYPKSPFCPLNDDNARNRAVNPIGNVPAEKNTKNPLFMDGMNQYQGGNMTKNELINIINELEFAVTDLNLFLDTHPNDNEALKTFTTLAAALKSYKHDYVQNFGPLYAVDSSQEIPFQWVSAEYKWPWQV